MERIVFVYTIVITLLISLLMYCGKILFYIMIIGMNIAIEKDVEILKKYMDIGLKI